MGKSFWLRLILVVFALTIGTVVMNAFEPSMSAKIAVGQLQDTYSSTANMTIYKELKNWSWLMYPVVLIIGFNPEIKKLLGGK